ncbi:MAG: RimK/LysX family protein [Gammaproteobacteria bacterium]
MLRFALVGLSAVVRSAPAPRITLLTSVPGLVLALLVSAGLPAAPALADNGKDIVGWVENVRLFPGNVEVKAKLDTGAKMSSLSCNCLRPFERDGEQWIGFQIETKNGKLASFERKIVGHIKIKRHFGRVQRRPVVELGICLGNVYKVTRVNLVDRSGFRYNMLIGRDDMQGHFVVDPGETFQVKPRCKGDLKIE